MLTIYRRHRRSCKQRAKGRKHRHCLGPIWVDGALGGKELRESLKLRDWQRAQEMIREWEAEDRRTRQQEQQITIKDAHGKFIADAEAERLHAVQIPPALPTARRFCGNVQTTISHAARSGHACNVSRIMERRTAHKPKEVGTTKGVHASR